MRHAAIIAMLIATNLVARPAMAEALRFDPGLPGWTAVAFPGVAPTRFAAPGDNTLAVSADSAAGLLWRPLSGPIGRPVRANWRWRVDQGVAPADLAKRGADDRSLGVYFVFGDGPAGAQDAMALLTSPSVTTLVYVFGGDRPRGSVVASPHMGPRGKFIVLRPASTAKQTWLDETVDVAADYLRAFGREMPALIGVAISSDSDDTRARNRASVQDFVVGE